MRTHPFLLDAETVADLFGLPVSSVWGLARRDSFVIPAQRFGRRMKFRRVDVENYLGVNLDEAFPLADEEVAAQ